MQEVVKNDKALFIFLSGEGGKNKKKE